MVWEWLVERFPIITLFITEEKYDELLDQALEEFRKMLESNDSLYDYVYDTLTVAGRRHRRRHFKKSRKRSVRDMKILLISGHGAAILALYRSSEKKQTKLFTW